MARRVLSLYVSFLVLFCGTSAQLGPDARWLTPDGSRPDLSSSFSAGSTITLSWEALNASKSDLWLTHWDPTTYPWHTQIASNVDISTAGTFNWYIDVTEDTIQDSNQFVLRFYPRNSVYTVLQFTQNSSPGFLLTGGTTTASSSSSAAVAGGGGGESETSSASASQSSQAATASGGAGTILSSSTIGFSLSSTAPIGSITSTQPASSRSSTTTILTTTNALGSTITATVTTSVPSQTGVAGSSQTTSTSSSSSSLSLAAQAGIGVGAGLFVIILFIAGCFFGRRFGIGRTLKHKEHGLEGTGFPTQQNHGAPSISPTATVAEAAEGKPSTTKPQTSNTAEKASLISPGRINEDNRRWYTDRTPWVEVTGDNGHAIEKSGAMVRPGVHEVE